MAKIERMRPDSPIITPTIKRAIAIVGMSNPLVPNVTLTNDPPAIFTFLPPTPVAFADGTITIDILLRVKHLFEVLISFSLHYFWSGRKTTGRKMGEKQERSE